MIRYKNYVVIFFLFKRLVIICHQSTTWKCAVDYFSYTQDRCFTRVHFCSTFYLCTEESGKERKEVKWVKYKCVHQKPWMNGYAGDSCVQLLTTLQQTLCY